LSGRRSQGLQPASGPQARSDRRRDRPPIRCALALGLLLALACVLLPASGPAGQALAWTLPGRTPAKAAGPTAGSSGAGANGSSGRIQEVAPPAAVQQLNEALAPRQPRLSILEPADGAILPDRPWTLRLQVEDWPLVDAGPLGLGPHLLVQLDEGLPTPVVDTTVTMPALTPGSHRLTVMAARPSGEVLKRPGAFQQIRLHRVAPNPLSLPAPGSPQLLPASPLGASAGEPVLVDWLLIDAPLQNLRVDDARWRLRVTVNGDSFLVDQQTPLWLKGWRAGSNAVLLELVDGRGEPLNPPFNSVVREVILRGGASRPAWLGGRLSEADLARLLGEAVPEIAPAPLPALAEVPAVAAPEPAAAVPPKPAPEPAPAGAADPEPAAIAPVLPTAPGASEPATPATTPPLSPSPADPMPAAPIAAPEDGSGVPAEPAGAPPQPSPSAAAPSPPFPAPAPLPPAGEGDPGEAAPRRSAREEVNSDGSLIRPARRSPLEALRARLQR